MEIDPERECWICLEDNMAPSSSKTRFVQPWSVEALMTGLLRPAYPDYGLLVRFLQPLLSRRT